MEVMRRHLACIPSSSELSPSSLAIHHGQQSQKVGDTCSTWLPVPWDHDILLGPVEVVLEKSTKWCRRTASDGLALT